MISDVSIERFIAIEGVEGAGKSSLISSLKKFFCEKKQPVCFSREPGGSEISESIRSVLLTEHQSIMCDDAELLLMFAARAQNLAQVIKPALSAGQFVVTDRFTASSLAYQGGGRGMSVSRIQALAQWVHSDCYPGLTFFLDVPVSVGLSRIKSRILDRIEQEKKDFFERVRAVYLGLADDDPERFIVIDAAQPRDRVVNQVCSVLEERLNNRDDANE